MADFHWCPSKCWDVKSDERMKDLSRHAKRLFRSEWSKWPVICTSFRKKRASWTSEMLAWMRVRWRHSCAHKATGRQAFSIRIPLAALSLSFFNRENIMTVRIRNTCILYMFVCISTTHSIRAVWSANIIVLTLRGGRANRSLGLSRTSQLLRAFMLHLLWPSPRIFSRWPTVTVALNQEDTWFFSCFLITRYFVTDDCPWGSEQTVLLARNTVIQIWDKQTCCTLSLALGLRWRFLEWQAGISAETQAAIIGIIRNLDFKIFFMHSWKISLKCRPW